jgi:hypothetical protein
MQDRKIPLALRLTGCWVIWSAWCSTTGWLLSAARQLDGLGYAILLPGLVGGLWCWLKATAPETSTVSSPRRKILQRLRRPAPLLFAVIALLSLMAGVLYSPWSYDAVSYRLPRILYWWSAHHWYWIGTLDRRLDYSSTGFEWQMLPVMMLTRSDRFLFLINWLPFLLMPGLIFVTFRGLGVNSRSAWRWMWLLPAGYCFALQCGGVQNDGYSVNYLLASGVFSIAGFHARRLGFALMSVLAAALLTGAKFSNAPLLLPLVFLLWPALRRVRCLNWKTPVILVIALICSFAPMTFLCWRFTGDWAGDPADQWGIKTHGAVGAIGANAIIFLNDAVQLPLLPASHHFENLVDGINHSAFINWLAQAHRQFSGFHFGDMAYEGSAGLGFGVAIYILFALTGGLFSSAPSMPKTSATPFAWRLSLWLAWFSYFVFLAKLGSYHSARIAAPYYPLLLLPLLRNTRVQTFERKRWAGILAVVASASVLPVIFLTPARPLIPIQTLTKIIHRPAIEKISEKYQLWDGLRNDLAPLRRQLPADAVRLGYAGGFHDTPYGLCKPPGSRAIFELGLPLGTDSLPPPDLKYAVVTARGIQERYHSTLPSWLALTHAQVIFEYPRNNALDSHTASQYESWFLVRFDSS